MPPDWDEDSPELRRNLAGLLERIEEDARHRKPPTVETARRWQIDIMRNLSVPDPNYVGAFRGEPGLENVQGQQPCDALPSAAIHPAASETCG
jgi:hypothetical protein